VNCSIYAQLLKELGGQGTSQPLFITGHSKGGALATLAALDLPQEVASAPKTVVYTFAPAKALLKDEAVRIADKTAGFWRFEYNGDIVPSLPTDGSFPVSVLNLQLPPFAHVGRRVLFDKNGQPDLAQQTSEGRDSFDDKQRLSEFYGIQPGFAAKEALLGSVAVALLKDCSPLRNHFSVFSAVQSIVWKKDSNAEPKTPFVKTGLFDANSGQEILWGYENWCDLVNSYPWQKLFQ